MADTVSDRRRLAQAAEWHLALMAEHPSAEDLARVLAWCDADPRNREALEQVQRSWTAVGALRPEADAMIAEAMREVAGAPPADARRAMRGAAARWRATLARPRAFGLGLAATGLLALAVWLLPARIGGDEQVEHLASARGATASSTLFDGSVVELGGRSAVSVLYTGRHRLLIAEDGEAFFRVRKDPGRPFVVRAGRVTATAVGTAFTVRREGESVSVAVSEGVVDVRLDGGEGGADAPPPVRARAGQRVRYDGGRLVASALPAAGVPGSAAWREGRLQFVDEPLRVVAASINRYSPRELIVADAAAEELRFTGTVFVPHLDDWLAALAAVHHLQVTQGPDQRVLIRSGKPAGS
jgi:transmembrane sensor